MLTRDLLRFRVREGRIEPGFLRPTAAITGLADNLLATWRAHLERSRSELEEAVQAVTRASRSQIVARGLDKLLQDRARFSDPVATIDLRARALAASAARLVPGMTDSSEAHRAAVATAIGHPGDLADDLYADLPDAARLETVAEIDGPGLVAAYNLALAQGLLLSARALHVAIGDRHPGRRRRLVKALRFQRLLARLEGSDGDRLTMTIAGPASVLESSRGYGLRLAGLLPHLATLDDWQLEADLDLGRGRGGGRLTLSSADGLAADSTLLAYVPEELRDLAARLGRSCADWTIDDDAPLLALPGGELVAADVRLETPTATWLLECFHRWHADALVRRVEQLAGGAAPNLLLAVDRHLARRETIATALARPAMLHRHCLFSGFPSARAIRQLVARVSA